MKCLPSACEAFCKYFLIIVWQFALNLHKGKLKEMRQNLGNSFVLRVFRQRSCAWCPAMYGIYNLSPSLFLSLHLPFSLNVPWSPWLALPYVDCFFVYDSNLMVYNFIRVLPSQPPSPLPLFRMYLFGLLLLLFLILIACRRCCCCFWFVSISFYGFLVARLAAQIVSACCRLPAPLCASRGPPCAICHVNCKWMPQSIFKYAIWLLKPAPWGMPRRFNAAEELLICPCLSLHCTASGEWAGTGPWTFYDCTFQQ